MSRKSVQLKFKRLHFGFWLSTAWRSRRLSYRQTVLVHPLRLMAFPFPQRKIIFFNVIISVYYYYFSNGIIRTCVVWNCVTVGVFLLRHALYLFPCWITVVIAEIASNRLPVFMDLTSCSLIEIQRRFWGARHFLLQDEKWRQRASS